VAFLSSVVVTFMVLCPSPPRSSSARAELTLDGFLPPTIPKCTTPAGHSTPMHDSQRLDAFS
jgi:hypothetical protein